MEEQFLILEVNPFLTVHIAPCLFTSTAGYQLLEWIIDLQERSLGKTIFDTVPFCQHSKLKKYFKMTVEEHKMFVVPLSHSIPSSLRDNWMSEENDFDALMIFFELMTL